MTQPSQELLLPVEEPKHPKRLYVVISIIAVVGLISAIIGILIYSTNQSTSLMRAERTCDPAGTDIFIADEGKTLMMNVKADNVETLRCVLRQTKATSAAMAKMEQTRALDGRQEAVWDGYKSSWTYHPDQGLNILIQEN